MPFHPPSIPFLGQVVTYIYDFCTYKKKWNVKIDFSRINKEDDFYYFNLYLRNDTFYHVNIGKIKAKEGEIFIGFAKINNDGIVKKEFISTDRERFDYGWKNLVPSNHARIDTLFNNNEAEIWIKFKGNKTKILIEYEMSDFPKSIFLSNRRIVSRIIPF